MVRVSEFEIKIYKCTDIIFVYYQYIFKSCSDISDSVATVIARKAEQQVV